MPILAYMAGSFVFSVSKHIQCESCQQVIHSNPLDPCPHRSLILLKSYNEESALDYDNLEVAEKSGLVIPSGTVVSIIQEAD